MPVRLTSHSFRVGRRLSPSDRSARPIDPARPLDPVIGNIPIPA
jgi:hypothetical protein